MRSATVGYYPAAGLRLYYDGLLARVAGSANTYLWGSVAFAFSPVSVGAAGFAISATDAASLVTNHNRSFGNPVRCVQEEVAIFPNFGNPFCYSRLRNPAPSAS